MRLLFWRRSARVYRPENELDAVFLQRVAPDLTPPYVEWVARWTQTLGVCHFYGCEIEPLRLEFPAKERHLARHEKKRKMQLPDPLRSFFLNVGKGVHFSWRNPDWALEFSDHQRLENPGGRLHLRLKDVTPVTRLDGWDPEALGEDADEVRAFLENAIAFMAVGNGDHLVIDMRDDRVKYLSHDDPDAMGVVLGPDFDAFMDAWSRLGCVGPEIWQLRPFLGPEGLDPESVNGRTFQKWLS